MIIGLESINIFSENARRLSDFYKNTVGLKQSFEAQIGEKGEELFGFETKGKSGINIIDHSKIKGKNVQPDRIIFNLEVDNIENQVKKLDEAGVKKITDIYHIQDYGLIATFEDIDGNYFQLVQIREN